MIFLFFSQMAALESAGFESMHGYSEVCVMSINYAGLPFLHPQFNECFSVTINNCRGTVGTMRRGPTLFASRIRSQGRAGTKHLLGSISNFANVCIKLNQKSHPSCSSMHQQWRAINYLPKWKNQCIVARW